MDCELIDFNNVNMSHINNNNLDEYSKFEKLTRETYRTMRELKLDPITHQKVPEELQFKFEYMWDPITGERLKKDKYGPLYFNVLSLAKNFYYNRLRLLWIDGEIENGIRYEGYYGDGVEAGQDLFISGRGDHKHMHLFRLPIIDCYLPEKFTMSIITMGPLLNNEEIKEIQNKIELYYKKQTKINKQLKFNLIRMKDLYDLAIRKSSDKNNSVNARRAVE
jgi:hypothetical protein